MSEALAERLNGHAAHAEYLAAHVMLRPEHPDKPRTLALAEDLRAAARLLRVEAE